MSSTKKAFDYGGGQYICHIYFPLPLDAIESLEEPIEHILKQSRQISSEGCWKPMTELFDDVTEDNCGLHVTLVRGHRAVYYHQIKPLVKALESDLQTLPPASLCLDRLKVFNNYESTKQFVCMTTHETRLNLDTVCPFERLKQILRETVDKFAMKLTEENETADTVAHCSLLFREVTKSIDCDIETVTDNLNSLFEDSNVEYPMCLARIDKVNCKIGNHIYSIALSNQTSH